VSSSPQPAVGRNDPHPLPESHMLVLEDTLTRHAVSTGAGAGHLLAGALLLLAACALLALLDRFPDRTTAARSAVPDAQAAQHHPGGSGAEFNAYTTCVRDRVCAEGGS
jgi:hypothetical protein